MRPMTATSPTPAPAPTAAYDGKRTAPELWRRVVARGAQTPAYLEETPSGWRPVPWTEAAERVEALAHGLLARGIRRGDAVAVLARTRLEWVLLDWATMSIGAVVVGLYPTSSARECAYILAHSEAVLAFAEDDAQADKLASTRDETVLRDVVGFEALGGLEEEGRAHRAVHPGALEELARELGEDELATLIYTSGTTGPPKGCMLTHGNLVTAAVRVTRAIQDEDDVVLLFLPLA